MNRSVAAATLQASPVVLRARMAAARATINSRIVSSRAVCSRKKRDSFTVFHAVKSRQVANIMFKFLSVLSSLLLWPHDIHMAGWFSIALSFGGSDCWCARCSPGAPQSGRKTINTCQYVQVLSKLCMQAQREMRIEPRVRKKNRRGSRKR